MSSPARRGPGRPPAAKSAETRGRILCAAREVFSEMGYDAATFQEIAARADLTRPAINHYFASKHILFQHVVDQATATVLTGIDEARNAESFRDRIQAFIRTTGEAQESDPSVSAFLVVAQLEAQRHPELLRDGSGALERTRAFMAAAVRDGLAGGELPAGTDGDALAELLVAVLWGLGFYAGFVGERRQMLAITDEFLRLVNVGGQLGNG
ncbi:MAG: TetR/AcrR family transcriptional regulator [Mycobacterium sp.]